VADRIQGQAEPFCSWIFWKDKMFWVMVFHKK
jgi:hypothetical protein